MTTHKDLRPANDDEGFELGSPLRTGRLDDILGFHLRMANVAIYQDYTAAMGDLGLTQKQFAVLELVAANPKVSQIDIANQLSMDRATMMALVNRLEGRNLVARQPSSVDRRRQELTLTGEGATMLTKARDIQNQHEARFTGRFSPKELQDLIAALKRIYSDASSDT
ncbi:MULTISPECIES: MarR family winged helix-turn-helix transcriptional regulator [Rhizobium]|uniref:MarR family transcriptional regulator n=1 Tax=Rhizobium wuzhouense TaxID=1986026 RepID=A0ABX5NK08_9HYPH|nr:MULTISPECIES: MarR family winged helix-turn-helix transcriptional regulator [Rhizobium]PYB69783.1 MarR family transcriptional regulator [Rhizobium wuzhouense]RKE79182.1 DNA-binding MarR family transcriptional regulator [Rhizobium sp. AG855]